MEYEVWKTIEEYPYYEVSSFGRVRSIDRIIVDSWGRKYFKKGQLIKIEKQQTNMNYTQLMVVVYDVDGKPHRVIVARLVAKTFIPNPNNYPQVNHIDEDSTNNHVDNLEWCTALYNINYGETIQRRSKTRSRAIDVYDLDGNYLDTCESAVEASKKYDVSRPSISECCHNKKESVKDLIFKFH